MTLLAPSNSNFPVIAQQGALSPVAPTPQQMQNMDLKSATYMLRRRARLIMRVTAATIFVAWVAAIMMTPMYKAETMLLLEPRHTQLVNIEDVLSPVTASAELLRSEMDIIQSRAVIDRVIDRLDLTEDKELNESAHFWNRINPVYWGQNDDLPEPDRHLRQRSRVAEALGKRLSVANDGRSYVITIGFQSRDARKAAQIANAFADAYLADQIDAKYGAIARANGWIKSRLGILKDKAAESEQAVALYRKQNNLTALPDGQTLVSRQMDDINAQLSAARGETSQAEAKLHTAQALVHAPGGIDSAADVLASPLIQNLREQEADLRRSEADLASRYGPLHPKMINAQAQMRDLQNKIAEETRKIIQGLASQANVARAKQKELEKQLNDLESRTGVESDASVALHELQREADADRDLYDSFLNRSKQTAEQGDMQVPDSRVIAAAEAPLKPHFPNKFLFVGLGALLGGLLGLLIAYLVEYFDKGYRHAAQIEESTGLPVIGIVPDIRALTPRQPEDYVASKTMSSYGEALRTVRAALHFSNVDDPPKVVMVTSSIPGEGKTTFCLSLARILAQAGNKILLIDADMRRSRTIPFVGVKKFTGGLAAILAGDQTFAETILPDPMVGNLDFIPAAGKAPNAQDMLNSLQMHRLIQDATALYDMVLIDTPPILAVSDAAMVARVSDATIFMVHWAKTPRDQAMQALKQLHALKCRIAGVVLSQVDLVEQAKYTDSYNHQSYGDYYVN